MSDTLPATINLRGDAPLTNISTCQELFKRFQGDIELSLPGHIRVDVMMSAFLNSVRKNPKLLQCSQTSMLSALMQCGFLGLIPDTPTQECHLIPFNTKNGWIVQWVAGYRGLIKLVTQSTRYTDVDMQVVYKGDEFSWKKGTDPRIDHIPALTIEKRDDSEVTHAYAVAYPTNLSARPPFEVMNRGQLDAIMKKSKAKDFGPWKTDKPEMDKKSVLKRLCKRLPQSPELAQAITLDNLAETGSGQPMHQIVRERIELETPTTTENLTDRMKQKADTIESPSTPEGGGHSLEELQELWNEVKDGMPTEVRNMYQNAIDTADFWASLTPQGIEEEWDNMSEYKTEAA